MAEHQDHDTVSAEAETESPTELEENGQNIQQINQDGEPDVTLLEEELGSLDLDGEAVEDNEMINEVEDNEMINEPTTRADFLQYFLQLTLDPDTANRHLSLSDENRKITVTSELQRTDHRTRFTTCQQVLSRQSLTGRCYWEVEWRGRVDVAVAYKNISRKGNQGKCGFGMTENSWALRCHEKKYNYRHNTAKTSFSDPRPPRLGVYLDHSAGILSFYSVEQDSETMTRLDSRTDRVPITFTQPLYAGLHLFGSVEDTAELCELQ